jgi:hypothetical protein
MKESGTVNDFVMNDVRTGQMNEVKNMRKCFNRHFRATMLVVLMVAIIGLLLPGTAMSQPVKKASTKCTQCHNGALDPGMTVHASVDGIEGTNFSVSPGSNIEIDFIFKGLRGYTPTRGVVPYMGLPAGWTPVLTTNASNPATLGGVTWSTFWDNPFTKGALPSDTPTWQPTGAEDGTVAGLVSTNMFKGLFEGSSWENASGSVLDDGTANDLDGTIDVMGADVRLTIPASGGPWTVFVGGVGHGTSVKATSYAAITLTLVGGDSTPPVATNDVAVAPESTTFVPAAFTVTASFNEPDGPVTSCDYTLNNGGLWTPGVVSGGGPYTCTANPTGQSNGSALIINMRASSAGGGPTVSTSIARTIDTAAPTTTDDVPAGWQATNTTVTLAPADAGSGLASTVYCVDQADACVPGTAYGAPFLVSTEDTNYVRYRSTDNLGNVQAVVSRTLQIDKTAPTDGALTPVPSDSQVAMTWTAASDATSGLTSPAYKIVMAIGTTTPPVDCSGGAIYTGDTPNHTQTGLTNGLDYAFRVCATDNAGWSSAGATATAQPSLVCVNTDPTITITNADKQITAGSGNVVYNVDVTNNDSVSCGDTTFSLSPNDSNGADFATSLLGTGSLLVSPGTTNSTTLTVAAIASPTNGNTNISSVTSAAAGPHGAVTSNNVNTLINIPGTPTMNYTVGELVHFEYRSSTRFNSNGTGALTVLDSSQASILSAVNMTETQQGATWIYTYDWDTTGQPQDTYTILISDSDVNPSAMSHVVLGNAVAKISFFADAGYTSPSSVFADSDTVYVEIILPTSESTTLANEIESYYGGLWTPTPNVTQTGTNYRFDFVVDFVSSGVADGDWGFYYWEGQDTGRWFHEPIKRSDGGCGTCTYTDPTISILTGNQTISTDAGSVNYTINVTNNDTVACGSTAFDLVASDTNITEFAAAGSTFGTDPLNIAPGSTGSTDLIVTAQTGNVTGTNDSYFYSALDVNHGQSLNSNTVTTTLSVADVAPPTLLITAPSGGSYVNAAGAEPIVITGTASDDFGTVTSADVQIDSGAWIPVSTGDGYANWNWNWAAAADGVHTIDVRASDGTNTGNAAQVSMTVDRTAPTTNDNVSLAWTNADRTVTLVETDATSGISSTVYCVDTTNSCAPGTAYAAPFAINQVVGQENVQYLRYFSTDVAGNAQPLVSKVVNIDKLAPSDGATFTPTAGDSTISLVWDAANDGGSNLEPTNTYKLVRADLTTTAPADCSGPSFYTGNLTSFVDNTVTNGNDYAYRVCAYDNVAFVSTGITATAQPAAACVRSNPTLAFSANQDITTDGGVADYTITLTNNDSGGCAAQTFELTTFTDNGASFTLSFPNGVTTASIGVGANDATLIARVTANGGALNTATHTVGVIVDGSGDPNHGDSLEVQAVTTMNVLCDVPPAVSYLTANQSIVSDGGNAVYNIQVQNDNAVACGSANLDLVVVDDNAIAFTNPSVFGTDPLSVNPGGGTNSTTITVTAQGGATNLAANNTYFYTAVNGSIPQSGNSAIRTTTINRPCVPAAPSFSHAVNRNIAPDGVGVYDLTIINNDVDCAASLFTFSIDSEVESNGGTFTLPSVFSAPNVSVASGATNSTVTLTVTGNGTGIELDTLTSTVRIADGSHADQTTAPVTTIKPFDPLVHSSASTGSTKHNGDGGWGVANAKYGEFTCATCHEPATTNIKRIRTVLPNAPDISKGDFPGAGGAISFLDATVPTTDFGDDTAAPRGSSNRICEACHTYDASKANGVFVHAYDQQVAAGHEDSKDCTTCHKHNDGFSKAGATCDSCHGYPPQPGDAAVTPVRTDDGFGYQAVEGKGAHAEHVNHLATLAGVTLDPNSDGFGDANVTAVCGVCHDMNGATHEMSGGAAANRNINFNGSAAFQFGPAAPSYNGVEDVSSGTTPKTCSNINCHYQATPEWE